MSHFRTAAAAAAVVVVAGGLVWLYLGSLSGTDRGSLPTAPEVVTGPEVGRPAPEVVLEEFGADEVLEIPADLEDGPFALIFFSYGCGWCRAEVLQLEPIQAELEDKGFALLVVSPGRSEDISFLAPKGFRVLLDPEMKAFKTYAVTAIPQTFFVDAAGILVSHKKGWPEGSLDEFLDTALELAGSR